VTDVPFVNREPVEVGIMVPCLNEEGNVGTALRHIVEAMSGLDAGYWILVVDDGSTDGTVDRVREFARGAGCPIACVSNRHNEGLGYNYFLGAMLLNSTYYMMVNGDGVEQVDDIREIIGARRRADIVIPYLRDTRFRGVPRRQISAMYTWLVNRLSGNRIRYYNGPVLHRRDTVVEFYRRYVTRGFGYQSEIICYALRNGRSYVEVAMTNAVRKSGRTSAFAFRNIVAVLRSLMAILPRRLLERELFRASSERFIVHEWSGSPGASGGLAGTGER